MSETNNTAATATQAIDITALTPAQLTALRKSLKEAAKTTSDQKAWNTLVDAMLATTEGDGFMYTTGDILDSLVEKSIVKAPATTEDKNRHLKKIQTRKQLLEKKRNDKGELIYKVGYKPSENAITVNLNRVLQWAATASKDDIKAAIAALKPLVK